MKKNLWWKKFWKKLITKICTWAMWAISTNSGQKSFLFLYILVLAPKIKLWTLKNASTATKAFVYVAPLRFPRDPFLFPLLPEFSLVVRYRATQTQRKQTAAKVTVVNKKIWFFSKNFSKAYQSITLQYLLSTRNFLATFLRLK